jgi:superoxide reductase
MNRRDALRVAGLAAVTVAVGAQAKIPEEYMNRIEMKPVNPAKLDAGELKHSPLVTLEKKDSAGYTMVHISVGQGGIIHPSTQDHWIDFIELYADNKLVGKNILEPEISRGATSFAVKLEGIKILTAKAGCNLHGIWATTVTL